MLIPSNIHSYHRSNLAASFNNPSAKKMPFLGKFNLTFDLWPQNNHRKPYKNNYFSVSLK